MAARQKTWARRRRLGAAARQAAKTKRPTHGRKQLIRDVSRRHGGR